MTAAFGRGPQGLSAPEARRQVEAALDQHKAHTEAEIKALLHEVTGLELQRKLLDHQVADITMLIDAKRAAIDKLMADHNGYRAALGAQPGSFQPSGEEG